MSRIICITKTFPVLDREGLPTGKFETLVDHAFDEDTLKAVIVPCDPPAYLGAKYDPKIMEWVIE